MADQAARKEQHHQHQHHAVDKAVRAAAQRAEPAARQLRRGQHDQGAEQRAGDRSQPTDQRKHRDLDREFERERGRGLEEGQVHGVEGAHQAGQRGRDHGRADLHPRCIHTHRARRVLAFAHGDQVEAETRMANQPGHPQGQRQEAEGDQQIGRLVAKDHPLQADVERHIQARRAAGDALEVNRQQAADFQHRNRRQREERAAQPHRRVGDDERGQHRHGGAGEHADPGRQAHADDQQRRGVAADAVEHRMAERELAGEAADDVPGRGQRSEHADLHRQVVDEGRTERERHGQDRQQGQRTDVGAWMGQVRKQHRGLAYSEPRPRPNSPVGRTTRMTRKITK